MEKGDLGKMESNYPDWCTGREKLRTIDKIEDESAAAVMREDIRYEMGVLREKLGELEELYLSLGGEEEWADEYLA